MDAKCFFVHGQRHLWLIVLRNIWLITIILASCGQVRPTPSATPTITATETPPATVTPVANVVIHITGKYSGTDTAIMCPPICVQSEKGAGGSDHSDEASTSPLTFRVCSPSTLECIDVISGETVTVPGDSTIEAPDGVSPGEKLPKFEEDSSVQFRSWEDGTTSNPRQIVLSNGTLEITAFYSNQDPNLQASTATEAGCNITKLFPEWVQVQPDPEYVDIQGPAVDTHIAGEDWQLTHNTNDLNFWVELGVDEQDQHLLSHRWDGQLGDRPNQIEVEWEEGSIPLWAWPSTGPTKINDSYDISPAEDTDIVWVRGKHIYDCGRQDSNEILEGAWTEVHPPIATATMRGTRQGRLFPKENFNIPELNERAKGLEGVQVDVWINGDGGGVVETLKCPSWDPSDPSGCVFDPSFNISHIYEFDVPLPPPPADLDPTANFRIINNLRLLPGQPVPEVTQTAVGLHVKIDLSNYKDTFLTCDNEQLVNCNGYAYGVTIIAGWEFFHYPSDTRRIRLTFEGITIYDDQEGEQVGDGEFKFLLQVGPSAALALNTEADVRLEKINKGLQDARGDGETYDLIKDGTRLTFEFNVNESNPESNRIYFNLDGEEEDLIWNDPQNSVVRTFYYEYSQGQFWPPDWATADYGKEVQFGTVRLNTSPPILYDDTHFPLGDCITVPACKVYSIKYTIEELPLP